MKFIFSMASGCWFGGWRESAGPAQWYVSFSFLLASSGHNLRNPFGPVRDHRSRLPRTTPGEASRQRERLVQQESMMLRGASDHDGGSSSRSQRISWRPPDHESDSFSNGQKIPRRPPENESSPTRNLSQILKFISRPICNNHTADFVHSGALTQLKLTYYR